MQCPGRLQMTRLSCPSQLRTLLPRLAHLAHSIPRPRSPCCCPAAARGSAPSWQDTMRQAPVRAVWTSLGRRSQHAGAVMASDLPTLAWWDDDDTPERMTSEIEEARKQLETSQAMAMFKKRSFLAFVSMANKLEGTLPEDYEDFDTYKMLEQLWEGEEQGDLQVLLSPDKQETWPAEGGGDTAQTRQQLLQFGQATRYLCCPLNAPLTVDIIKTTHKIMMSGAMEEGDLLAAGEFCTTAAHSGTGYVYLDASSIPQRLEEIVSNFNTVLASKQTPSFSLAADLLYQFVTLHPFPNGNGRMCRLLAAYAVLAAGAPFLANLSDGHKKTRQHYHQVLRHADKHMGNTARLRSYILDCIHMQWQNAVAYAGHYPPS